MTTVEVPREAVSRLILAADCYGVRFLDSDDMSDEAQELQDATEAMKDLLAAAPTVEDKDGWREKVARIIDPTAWAVLSNHGPEQAEFMGITTGVSLAKADAILALLPPLVGSGGGLGSFSPKSEDTHRAAEGAVVARLTAALTPFAAMIGHIDDHYDDHDSPDWTPFIPVGAYRAAYAALATPASASGDEAASPGGAVSTTLDAFRSVVREHQGRVPPPPETAGKIERLILFDHDLWAAEGCGDREAAVERLAPEIASVVEGAQATALRAISQLARDCLALIPHDLIKGGTLGETLCQVLSLAMDGQQAAPLDDRTAGDEAASPRSAPSIANPGSNDGGA